MSEVDLMASSRSDPQLVSGAPLHQMAPRVSAGVILVGIHVGIRIVSEEEKSLGFPRIFFRSGRAF